jgi:hypothetical protein
MGFINPIWIRRYKSLGSFEYDLTDRDIHSILYLSVCHPLPPLPRSKSEVCTMQSFSKLKTILLFQATGWSEDLY